MKKMIMSDRQLCRKKLSAAKLQRRKMKKSVASSKLVLMVCGLMVTVDVPVTALAAEQVSVSVAGDSGKTNAYLNPGGVTVVNIDSANNAGLSHNRFNSYNVNEKGLILNNGAPDKKSYHSQLAGVVLPNHNLKQSANVILNEVVTNNRSELKGFTEITGARADVVLANPWGITCSGCGFINTDRVTLSTGKPELNSQGGLAGLSISQGDILIQGKGLNASDQQILDLVTRSVKIDGKINGQDVMLVSGANRYDYVNRSVTGQIQTAENKPQYAIDSTALGGMYANRIRLMASEAGVGVRMLGESAASQHDFILTAAGKIILQNQLSAQQNVSISNTDTGSDSLTLHNASVMAQQNIQLTSSGDIKLAGGAIIAGNNLVLDAAGLQDNATDNILQNNNVRNAVQQLQLKTTNAAGLYGTGWGAGQQWRGYFASLSTGQGTQLQSSGDLKAVSDGDMRLGLAQLQSVGDLHLTASAGNITIDSGDNNGLQSLNGQLQLTSDGLDNGGVITADQGDVILHIHNSLINKGSIHAAQYLRIADGQERNSQTLNNQGSLLADSISLLANHITNSENSWIQAISGSQINSGQLDNQGYLLLSQQVAETNSGENQNEGVESVTDSIILSGDLNNHGLIQSDNDVMLQAQNISNSRTLLSHQGMVIDVTGDVTNQNQAQIQTANQLRISANKQIINQAGIIQSDSIQLTANDLDNQGLINARQENAILWLNESLNNSGVLQAQQDLNISALRQHDQQQPNQQQPNQQQPNQQQRLDRMTNSGKILAGGKLNLDATSISNQRTVQENSGWIQAGSSDISGNSLLNSGTWLLSGINEGSQITLQNNLNNSGLLYFTGNGTLNADHIDNEGQLQFVGSGTLRAGKISNSGSLYATNNLDLTASADIVNNTSVNNTSGKTEVDEN